jgi:methylthioribose-1-phosphate isomerase
LTGAARVPIFVRSRREQEAEAMKVDGTAYRSIWADPADGAVRVIDQRALPHAFVVATLGTREEAAAAIREMWVRGAPLIGATAAWGLALHLARDASDAGLEETAALLLATRPTAVNLAWALERMRGRLAPLAPEARAEAARAEAARICDEDVAINTAIGEAGVGLIEAAAAQKGGAPVTVMTHCNAGWLATVDVGTATAPIYRAHDRGIAVHVIVSETRPRNQGAALTAWELGQHGVPHSVIVDNAAGHLLQRGEVDMVITGTDRTTARGDVCNKIGTYMKALAAKEAGVPFYVALPSPTIDWTIEDGIAGIPIEERGGDEVSHVYGLAADGTAGFVRVTPAGSPARNPAFDVTPARLVTGLITERGVVAPGELRGLFPEAAGGLRASA